MLVQTMQLDTNLVNLSSLLGVRGHQEVLQHINQNAGGSYYGSESDPFRQGFQTFMNQVVEPIRQASVKISNVINNFVIKDEIKCIDNVKILAKGIPPKMQLPIIYYEPVRTMLDDGAIDGFGIDPSKLAKDDPYADMCKSGVVDITTDTVNDKGEYEVEFIWNSDDPDLTPEEIMNITLTREFIDKFLKDETTKYLDPTNYPELHG